MRRIIIGLIAAMAAGHTYAQEPVGCDKFKWPLDRERALLTAPDATPVDNGAEIAPPVGKAVTIRLVPFADARLPMAPERVPRSPETKAGFIKVTALKQPGVHRITLSVGGWLDVIQDGRFVKSGAFSGALGCQGVRKSVTFDLGAMPLIVQVSGVPADAVSLVVTPP